MNKYLVKLASKKVKDFIGLVTGSKARDAASRVKYLEEAAANNYTARGAKRHQRKVNQATFDARLGTGAVAGAGALGTAYGYKKYRDKQKAETLKQYGVFFKEASTAEAAKIVGKAGASGVGRLLRHIGRTTADMMNTAGGGKIKDYATTHGFKHGTKEYKGFVRGDKKHQIKAIIRKQRQKGVQVGKEGIRNHVDEIKNLHRNARDAKIALTSTGAAAVSAYGWKKARDANKRQNPYY